MTEDIANVIDRVFKVEYTHSDPRNIRSIFSKVGEVPDLFPCHTSVPGVFHYFIRYERKESAACVMDLDLKSNPGLRVYPISNSASLTEEFRARSSVPVHSKKRKRESEQVTQASTPHRPNGRPGEEGRASLPKRPRIIPLSELRCVTLGNGRRGDDPDDPPRYLPNARQTRGVSPPRRLMSGRPSDVYPMRGRSPLRRAPPRSSLNIRPPRVSPPLPRNALPPRPRSPLRHNTLSEVESPLRRSTPPGGGISQCNNHQPSSETRPASKSRPTSVKSVSQDGTPSRFPGQPVGAESPLRPTQPSLGEQKKPSNEGNALSPSLDSKIVVTVNGRTIAYDLDSKPQQDPQAVIEMLRVSKSERGNWMTAGAYFRRTGKTHGAIAIIYAMLEAMAKAGVEDQHLKPAFLLLSGCELDLGLGAKAKGDITTSKYHYMNMRMWLQRVYGQSQISAVVQPEPSVSTRPAPSCPEPSPKQKTVKFGVVQYKRKENFPRFECKRKTYATRQYHEKIARQKRMETGGYKETGFRTEGRYAGNNEIRKGGRM